MCHLAGLRGEKERRPQLNQRICTEQPRPHPSGYVNVLLSHIHHHKGWFQKLCQ